MGLWNEINGPGGHCMAVRLPPVLHLWSCLKICMYLGWAYQWWVWVRVVILLPSWIPFDIRTDMSAFDSRVYRARGRVCGGNVIWCWCAHRLYGLHRLQVWMLWLVGVRKRVGWTAQVCLYLGCAKLSDSISSCHRFFASVMIERQRSCYLLLITINGHLYNWQK